MIRLVQRIVVRSLALVVLAAVAMTIAVAESCGARAPITKAQAVAFAQAVNLRAGDLPGAEALPQSVNAGSTESTSHVEVFSCGRKIHSQIHSPYLGGASSLLADRYAFMASVVLVAPSDALAKANAAALASRRGRTCLARVVGEAETVEGKKTVTSHTIRATFVPVAKLLGPEGIAVHVITRPPALGEPEAGPRRTPKGRVPKSKGPLLYIDATFFRVRSAEILFLTFGGRRFPPAIEGRLLALLHSRAEAYRL